jgi:hypothetical protein
VSGAFLSQDLTKGGKNHVGGKNPAASGDFLTSQLSDNMYCEQVFLDTKKGIDATQ